MKTSWGVGTVRVLAVLVAGVSLGGGSVGVADAELEGEPLEYAILAANSYEGSLEFASLDRFPDMKLDPRLEAPGIPTAERVVVTGASAWSAFWRRANPDLAEQAERLMVDFSRHVVLISAAGVRQGRAGETVVVDVLDRPEEVLVRIEETDKECGKDGEPSHPLAVVRMARPSKPIRFDVQSIPCAGE